MKAKEKLHSTQLLMMVAYLALQLVGTVIIAADDQAAPSPAPAPAVAPKLQLALPGCPSTCGDVQIPYPFGIGNSSTPGDNKKPCYLEDRFSLTCSNDSKLLYSGNLQVLRIDILQGQLDFLFYVASTCNGNHRIRKLTSSYFSISRKENRFVTVGCDSFGNLNSSFDGDLYMMGCLTRCYGHHRKIQNGTCSGIGCCQMNIPPRMRNISIEVIAYSRAISSPSSISAKESLEVETSCTSSFVVKQNDYAFSTSHLQGLPHLKYPMVVDWTVGDQNCSVAPHKIDYACRNNSHCNNTDTDFGYRCECNPGFEGNPYHPDGCTDIDECKIGSHRCISKDNCNNTIGNYTCFCPKGQFGDGTKEGNGCNPHDERHDERTKIVIGAGIGASVLFVGTTSLYLNLKCKKWKLIKMKKKFFQQNGGFLLKQQISKGKDSSQTAQIFTENQLKKATNNFDESFIIDRGGFGTVYKGFLPNNTTIAVKKSKIMNVSQIKQFINEVDVLLKINHRNVVKLLGCCLETEVPLLVYESVNNGTLFEFLHTKGKANNVIWKTRLRIATEVAGALSYLHSSASIPIIHRDVKSANILLDDTYTAKVSDFGASRLVPLDQIEIATMVQGTIGYLDPEYMQTNQLTEKSDVYSFGVVLVELLTGEKPFPSVRKEEKEKRSLAMHFLSCLEEDRVFEVIQDGILDEENEQEIKEVAILAAKCLRLKGEERPTMEEVVVELEGIMKSMEKHSWINSDIIVEELNEISPSNIFEPGDSSGHGSIVYDRLVKAVDMVLDMTA